MENLKEISIKDIENIKIGNAENKKAGTGATVGKIHGADGCMKSGIGSYAVQIGKISCQCNKIYQFFELIIDIIIKNG